MKPVNFAVVELDNGDQYFGDTPYEAFKFAKEREAEKPNSVEYVALGEFYERDDGLIYSGQELRHLLRALDNVIGWLKTSMELPDG
jgi:hypothetical protein